MMKEFAFLHELTLQVKSKEYTGISFGLALKSHSPLYTFKLELQGFPCGVLCHILTLHVWILEQALMRFNSYGSFSENYLHFGLFLIQSYDSFQKTIVHS